MIPSVDKQVHLFYTCSMKLSQYAKQGIGYRTAFRWFRTEPIKRYQAPSRTIIVVVEHRDRLTRFGCRYPV
jgi:hypothetical protein